MKYFWTAVVWSFLIVLSYNFISNNVFGSSSDTDDIETITTTTCGVTTLPCYYDALAQSESGGSYKSVNAYGYMGKYQFGMSTLETIGIHTTQYEFLNNPELQEKAIRLLVKHNRRELRRYIARHANTTYTLYNGKKVYITEAGMQAGAHLGGAGAVKRFFDTNGRVNRADANGTSVLSYMIKFSNTEIG